MIFFLHIPKTAGTSLTTVLKIQYKQSAIYSWDNIKFWEKIEEFRKLPNSSPQKTSAKVLKGHFPFGIHEYIDGNFTYISFLRDPKKRLISHLIQFLRMPNSDVAKDFNAGMSVADILQKYPFFKNLQTNWIAGENCESKINDQDLLDKAISNIEKHFTFVGITEKFDESLLLIGELLEWRLPPVYSNLNVSKIKEKDQLQLKSEDLLLIDELNQYDQMLYDHALELFEKKLHASKINLRLFQYELSVFQKAHRSYLSAKKFLKS